jgi:uncharacterized protein YqkB
MTTTSVAYFFFDRVNKKEYNPSYQTPFLKSAVEALSNTVKKAKKV